MVRVKIGQLVRAARYGHDDRAFRRQDRVARAARLPQRRVWEIENERGRPSEQELAQLCQVLPLLAALLRLCDRGASGEVETAGRV